MPVMLILEGGPDILQLQSCLTELLGKELPGLRVGTSVIFVNGGGHMGNLDNKIVVQHVLARRRSDSVGATSGILM